jgi:flagellar biogenesis protein FliO
MTRVALALLILLTTAPAAAGRVKFADGRLTLEGVRKGRQSLSARGKRLIVVMAASDLRSRTFDLPNHPLVKSIRIAGFSNRTEVEFKLHGDAVEAMAKLRIVREGERLQIWIARASGAAPAMQPMTDPLTKSEPKKPAVPRIPVALPVAAAAPAETVATKATPPVTVQEKPTSAKFETSSARNAALGALVGSKKTAQQPPAAGLVGERGQDKGPGNSIWTLAGVGAFGVVLLWWLKRKKKNQLTAGTAIEMIATKALSNKHRLVVIEVAQERMLLGCTEKEVQLIRVLGRPKVDATAEVVKTSPINLAAAPDAVKAAAAEPKKSAGIWTTEFAKRLAQQLKLEQAAKVKSAPVAEPVIAQGTPASKAVTEEAETWADEFMRFRRGQTAVRDNDSSSRELGF